MSIFMYVSYVGFLIHSWFSSDVPYLFPRGCFAPGLRGLRRAVLQGHSEGDQRASYGRTKRSRVIRPRGDGAMINYDKCWVMLNLLKHIITSIT